MGFNLTTALDAPAAALALRAERAKVLGNNIANADTPRYQARDFDFRQVLAARGVAAAPPVADRLGAGRTSPAPPTGLLTTHPSHRGLGGPGRALPATALQYRLPAQPALDQNTVDTQAEQSAFADNALRYQATLSLLNRRIGGLMTAITGR